VYPDFPEGRFTVTDILTLPLDDVKYVQNPILTPIDIQDTIEDCEWGKHRWKTLDEDLPEESGLQGSIRYCENSFQLTKSGEGSLKEITIPYYSR
jgi:hypothetical protein